MRASKATFALVLSMASVAIAADATMPEFPKPGAQHAWLQQFTGEWTADIEMFPPGQPPIKSKGTTVTRPVGGFWIIAEHQGEFMGEPFTGVQTLGYDAKNDEYVGSWIDSVSGYFWKYQGSLDKAKKKLTLSTEGPCPAAAGEMLQFQEVIELKSDEHYVFTSSTKGEDGQWVPAMRIEYHRK